MQINNCQTMPLGYVKGSCFDSDIMPAPFAINRTITDGS